MQDDQTSNKLIILFVLDKLSMPIQEDVLIEMCCYDNKWIASPMFAKQTVLDLEVSGFVNRFNGNNGNFMISLTEDGATCLGHFFKNIHKSLRDDITDFTSKNAMKYKKKQEFFSDYKRNKDNSYTVTLKISEINRTIMELQLNVPSRSLASKIYETWGDKAIDTYKSIYDLLLNI